MKDTRIFALTTNVKLVEEICNNLGIKPSAVSVKHFADDEILVELGETVRGKRVFLVQSTCKPTNDRLMELLIAIDCCKRSSAKEINVIIPYYGYARQDRKASPRQPITSKLVATMLEAAGANRVITCDLHADQIQGFFSIPEDNLTIVPMIGAYFLRETGLDFSNTVVVSPDHGGVTRARRLANILGTSIAIIDKRRPAPNVVEVSSIIGEVKDKNCIVVDDICDTAGTHCAAAHILKEYGAKDIYLAITHGIFSRDALLKLNESDFKQIVVSNTIPLDPEIVKANPKIKELSIASMMARLIEAISLDTPVSEVYNLYDDKKH